MLVDKYNQVTLPQLTTFNLEKNKFNVDREKSQIDLAASTYYANPDNPNLLKSLAKLNGYVTKDNKPDVNAFLNFYLPYLEQKSENNMTELTQEAKDILEKYRQQNEAIKPVNSGLVKDPDENDINFWRTLGDMALAVPKGIVNAVEEQGDFIDENIVNAGGFEFGDGDGKTTFTDFIPRYVPPSKWNSKDRNIATFKKPETLAGNMTEGVSRFITGFYTPSKFLKGVGLSGGFVKTSLRGMVAGAATDLTVFDPNEGRLSDMLVEFDSPLLNNAVTQYLATDEDDIEMEGRLKNVLEGIVVGGPLEILMGIKAFKRAKGTQNITEKEKIYKEMVKLSKN